MNKLTAGANQTTIKRRLITAALCALVALSCFLPYISYLTPVYDAVDAEQALSNAQAVYEADYRQYEEDRATLAQAQRRIDEIQPEYDRVKAELGALEADESAGEDALTELRARFGELDADLVASRKITSNANQVVPPVPVQNPVPATTTQAEAYSEALESGQPIPSDVRTVSTHTMTGLQVMTGAMSAANHTRATWTLIPGIILMLASVLLSLLGLKYSWRRLVVIAAGMLILFSALRLDTATAREMGAIGKVYWMSFGYAIAIAFSLVAIVWVSFEQKKFEFSLAKTKAFVAEKAIYLVLLALIAIIGIIRPRFFSTSTLINIIQQSSTRLIIAMGMSFVIIGTGGVDLSACRMIGMAAVVSASMLQMPTYSRLFFPDLPQLPVVIPFLIAVIIALIFGITNGTIVAKLGVPPFIATLATQVIVYGATSIYFNLEPNNSQPIGGLREDFTYLGSGSVYGFIPVVVLIALVVCIMVWYIQKKTIFGKNVFAIGGNREAAKVSGINVSLTIVAIFALASTLIGMAGVLEAARTGGATNNYGVGYELDAIAACVVGGVSSSGGVGTIGGIVSGVFIFQVINYGLTFLGVNPYWQQIIKGIIIATAVALDIRKYMARK